MTERRIAPVEIRAPGDQPGLFEAVVMRYGILDDYQTIFDPGCFTASLTDRLPRITWGHSWTDVIGRYVDYIDTPESLTLIGQLDDFDAVPRARQAYAQLQSGTIDQFSVGFRVDPSGAYLDDAGIRHFRSATLDEVALVLSGAVPGTELVQVRTGLVDVKFAVDLAEQVVAGTITKEAAYVALDLAAGESVAPPPPVDAIGRPVESPGGSATFTLDDAELALEELGWS